MNFLLASIILTVAAYLFSYLWFGPLLFRSLYERFLEKSNKAKPLPRLKIFLMFFGLTYLAMSTMGYFIAALDARTFLHGARIGLYIWLFYFSVEFANSMFNRVNLIVQSINWIYWLVVTSLCGGFFVLLLRL